MKVYFAFSTFHLHKHLNQYRKIVRAIRSLGHDLTIDLIAKARENHKNRHFSTIKSEREEFRKEAIERIENADVLIGETSLPSSGVGFQIAYALSRKKPVLLIYSKNFGQRRLSKVIEVVKSPLLRISAYDKDIKKVVSEFFDNPPRPMLTKFNFIITTEIEDYLNWLHSKTGRSKSEVLRKKIINKIIRNDEEYKTFFEKNPHEKYFTN